MTVKPYSNLKQFVGRVTEISPKYKAIVQFQLGNKLERALLWYDKLKINNQSLPENGTIDMYIKKDTSLKFLCHNFDESGADRCGWYITCAWQLEDGEDDLKSNDNIVSGVYNCTGRVAEVARRQGILTFSLDGVEEHVLFLASKLFFGGKRVSSKASLTKLPGLEEESILYFDAVPSDPMDEEGQCNWFATVVWKGRKPVMEYEDVHNMRRKEGGYFPLLTEIKLITSNPHSLFLRSEGRIMEILNDEYGLVLACLKNNRWESVLFHCSQAALFGCNLASKDLNTIFKEGDKVYVVAAAAPKKMGVRWVASHVRPLVDPSMQQKLQL